MSKKPTYDKKYVHRILSRFQHMIPLISECTIAGYKCKIINYPHPEVTGIRMGYGDNIFGLRRFESLFNKDPYDLFITYSLRYMDSFDEPDLSKDPIIVDPDLSETEKDQVWFDCLFQKAIPHLVLEIAVESVHCNVNVHRLMKMLCRVDSDLGLVKNWFIEPSGCIGSHGAVYLKFENLIDKCGLEYRVVKHHKLITSEQIKSVEECNRNMSLRRAKPDVDPRYRLNNNIDADLPEGLYSNVYLGYNFTLHNKCIWQLLCKYIDITAEEKGLKVERNSFTTTAVAPSGLKTSVTIYDRLAFNKLFLSKSNDFEGIVDSIKDVHLDEYINSDETLAFMKEALVKDTGGIRVYKF